MRWVLCAAVWVIANAAGLMVAALTKWGPIVVEFSPRHGVHLGDVVAVVVGLAIAAAVTAVVWATAPERPDTRVVLAWVAVAAVWEVCLVASLVVAASTDYGPVLARVWRNKPVRLGDVVVVLGGVAVATAVTALVWRLRPPTRVSARDAGPAAEPAPEAADRSR